MKFRTAYDHGRVDPDTGEIIDYATHTGSHTRTKQSMKDECDINVIVARYKMGEDITHVNERAAQYADLSEVPDYRTALDNVIAVEAMFMELSAEDRSKFDNDPALYLDAIASGYTGEAGEKISEDVSTIVDTNPSDDASADAPSDA